MDAQYRETIAYVQTLMAVRVVPPLFQAGLLFDRHNFCILIIGLLTVLHLMVSLYIIISPSFNLSNVLHSRIRQSDKSQYRH